MSENCELCGHSWSDSNVPHYCKLIKELELEKNNQLNNKINNKKEIKEKNNQLNNKINNNKILINNTNNIMNKSNNKVDTTNGDNEEINLDAEDIIASSALNTKTEKIEVFIRIRPLLEHELNNGYNESYIKSHDQTNEVEVISDDVTKAVRVRFDKIFDYKSSQIEIYKSLKSCTTSVLDGYNSTIFAYGQTGSGKTHTMFGPPGYTVYQFQGIPGISARSMEVSEYAGIIPRVVHDIFEGIKLKKNQQQNIIKDISENKNDNNDNNDNGDGEWKDFTVYCSFVQIYNESLFDMLRDPYRDHPLSIREDPEIGIYVEGLSEYVVRNASECLELLRVGEENRAIRETHMNEFSSRSHSLFQLILEQTKIVNGSEINFRSKFNLVDLAGSEKWNVAYNDVMVDGHVHELTRINLSLHTLGKCITALSSGSKHIPFRESKLTRILQDSLGGNTRTRLLATLSPIEASIEESVSTLKFADCAKRVLVYVHKNERRPVDYAMVQRLQQEIRHLRSMIQAMQGEEGSDGQMLLDLKDQLQNEKIKNAKLKKENEKLKKLIPSNILNQNNLNDNNNNNNNNKDNNNKDNNNQDLSYLNGAIGATPNNSIHAYRHAGFLPIEDRESEENLDIDILKNDIKRLYNDNQKIRDIFNQLKSYLDRFFLFEIEEDELQNGVKSLLSNINPPYKPLSLLTNDPNYDQMKKDRNKLKKPVLVLPVQSKDYPNIQQDINNNENDDIESYKKSLNNLDLDRLNQFNHQLKLNNNNNNNNNNKEVLKSISTSPSHMFRGNQSYNLSKQQKQEQKQEQKQKQINNVLGNISVGKESFNNNNNIQQNQYQNFQNIQPQYNNIEHDNFGNQKYASPKRPLKKLTNNRSNNKLIRSTLLKKKAKKLPVNYQYRVRGKGGKDRVEWVEEKSEEEILREELKKAKAKMKKQMQLQEWLKKKAEKEMLKLAQEEAQQQWIEAIKKERDRRFHERANKQKKKLENYYKKIRNEAENDMIRKIDESSSDEDNFIDNSFMSSSSVKKKYRTSTTA